MCSLVLRCASMYQIERQLQFPVGMNKVYCCCCCCYLVGADDDGVSVAKPETEDVAILLPPFLQLTQHVR